MNLKLKRTEAREDGVFSVLKDENGVQIAVTLEHAYDQGDGSYAPKLQPGTYLCVRGMHRLHNMKQSFETFEITGVTGHTNILFHVGNYNDDSEGCVLLGHGYGGDPRMITQSRMTFEAFMGLQQHINQFKLTVES